MEVGEVPDLGEQPHWLQTGPGIASVETVVDESDVPSQQNHSVGETSSISSSELDALRTATRAHLDSEGTTSSLDSVTKNTLHADIFRATDGFDSMNRRG